MSCRADKIERMCRFAHPSITVSQGSRSDVGDSGRPEIELTADACPMVAITPEA